MATPEANSYLKYVLKQLCVDGAPYGTHSAKHTAMSWIARATTNVAWRKLLGGHVISKNRTMEGYSRDLLTRPLAAFEGALEEMRGGRAQDEELKGDRWALTANPEVEAKEAT